MTYSNIPHSIAIVGVLFVSAIALMKHVDHPLFWIAIALAFILAMLTWVRLDSDDNDERKRLILEKMGLENKKLELENKELELENKKLKIENEVLESIKESKVQK